MWERAVRSVNADSVEVVQRDRDSTCDSGCVSGRESAVKMG